MSSPDSHLYEINNSKVAFLTLRSLDSEEFTTNRLGQKDWVGQGEEEIEVARRVYLGLGGEIRVVVLVLRQFHFRGARALVVFEFVFDLEEADRDVGTWVCFSPARGKWCSTKIVVFYFEQLLCLWSYCLRKKVGRAPAEEGIEREKSRSIEPVMMREKNIMMAYNGIIFKNFFFIKVRQEYTVN